jgi:hypothetical protein
MTSHSPPEGLVLHRVRHRGAVVLHKNVDGVRVLERLRQECADFAPPFGIRRPFGGRVGLPTAVREGGGDERQVRAQCGLEQCYAVIVYYGTSGVGVGVEAGNGAASFPRDASHLIHAPLADADGRVRAVFRQGAETWEFSVDGPGIYRVGCCARLRKAVHLVRRLPAKDGAGGDRRNDGPREKPSVRCHVCGSCNPGTVW